VVHRHIFLEWRFPGDVSFLLWQIFSSVGHIIFITRWFLSKMDLMDTWWNIFKSNLTKVGSLCQLTFHKTEHWLIKTQCILGLLIHYIEFLLFSVQFLERRLVKLLWSHENNYYRRKRSRVKLNKQDSTEGHCGMKLLYLNLLIFMIVMDSCILDAL
jgi:hypothetical protein